MEGKKGKLRISVENEGEMLNKADKDAKWKRNKKKMKMKEMKKKWQINTQIKE